jgi:hypothetical protein
MANKPTDERNIYFPAHLSRQRIARKRLQLLADVAAAVCLACGRFIAGNAAAAAAAAAASQFFFYCCTYLDEISARSACSPPTVC